VYITVVGPYLRNTLLSSY